MAVNIEIKDEHVKEMIEFYVNKQRSIKTQMLALEKQSRDVSAIIQKLNMSVRETNDLIPLPDVGLYSDSWTWVKKIKFAFEQMNKPLTTREIVDTLAMYEPSIEYNRKKAVASVSSTLSVKTGEEFNKYENDNGENEYTLIDEQTKDINNHNSGYGYVDPNSMIDDLPF